MVITGTNGSGKSWFARELAMRREDLEIVSYDAVRLTQDWAKRPEADVAKSMAGLVSKDSWIIEGGPGLLRHALHRAEGVVWLDPSPWLRALRLAYRPWQNLGNVRDELPTGNVDWPLQQYRFGIASLANGQNARAAIETSLRAGPKRVVWHCRSKADVSRALEAVSQAVFAPDGMQP
ncbi:MAG: DNA topology modulation protein FlaR [Pseudomonadota bacterium]